MSLSGRTDQDSPTEAVGAPIPLRLEAEPWAGSARYAVIETIGTGGMGTVRRAYDAKLRREVALKVLRSDRRVDAGVERMVREAQAMAQLSHPNVVAVYDVEETHGNVLIAMEYVRGKTLKEWLRDEPAPAELLAAFVAAGQGLAAAHRAGLVHRDFKPSNVLVGEDGVVKVSDFGLAKSLASGPDDLSGGFESVDADSGAEDLTRGGTVVGTPRYMAPEQHRGQPATAAGDQYSFCLALWESLFHTRLHRRSGVEEILSAKVEGPPALGSERPVSTRALEAVRRGLEPDPAKRWPDMARLLDALDGAPRQRRGFAAGALLVGAAVAAVLVGVEREDPCDSGPEQFAETWNDTAREQARVALTDAAPFAADAWPEVARALDGYVGAWLTGYREACEATHVRNEQSTAALDLRMGCLAKRRRAFEATVEVLSAADGEVAARALDLVGSLGPTSSCADAEALRRDVPPPEDPSLQPEIDALEAELARVDSLSSVRKHEEALALAEPIFERANAIAYVPIQVDAGLRVGRLRVALGKGATAIGLLRQMLARGLEARLLRKASVCAATLAKASIDEEPRLAEAEIFAELALSLAVAVDPRGAEVARANTVISGVRQRQGRYAQALAAANETLALRSEAAGDASLAVATALRMIGLLQGRLGKFEEAEEALGRSLALTKKLRGHRHPLVADMLQTAGILRGRQLDYEGASAHLRQALEIHLENVGSEHRSTAEVRVNYATALRGQGKLAEAREQLQLARGVTEAVFGADHHRVADIVHALAQIEDADGNSDAALAHFQRAVQIYEKTFGSNNLDLALLRYNLGQHLTKMGRWVDAVPHLERSLEVRVRSGAPEHFIGDTAWLLARALDAIGKNAARARELANDALERYAAATLDRSETTAEVEAWLAADP